MKFKEFGCETKTLPTKPSWIKVLRIFQLISDRKGKQYFAVHRRWNIEVTSILCHFYVPIMAGSGMAKSIVICLLDRCLIKHIMLYRM